ncbi:ABC transporter permease [Sutcliffiella rhizosphaerae]|uniref:ABC transmembrane type-2 domain-containing protein n=1 Tax=Sutcliffiella rhizosphaerae TaxID=2880967 RepID=A0ABN8AA49_9BACI|nr:ABC transporter permease [Sutcliffiella rhizosphaerae]CAG9622081.1 hypothetical protein BACCIP111883_02872 [Sutcliffiella rhizosphaerae]
MKAILLNHLQQLRRQPFAFIAMLVLTVVFAMAVGMVNKPSQSEIPVFSNELSESEQASLLKALNEGTEQTSFVAEEGSVVMDKLENGIIDLGIQIERDSYKLYMTIDDPQNSFIESHIGTVLQTNQLLSFAADQLNTTTENLQDKVENENELFSFTKKSFNERDFIYDNSLQALFGFSLFFVMFTVSFTVSTLLDQKRNGIWNRMVLSPLTKTQMYFGHISYSFLIGYLQLTVVYLFFHFIIGVELYGGFPLILVVVIPYLFALVSLGVLISSLVTNPRQLDAIVPLISVSMAMIGGAYWPLEIVQTKALLFLSKLVPITYGMEMLKGATILDWSLSQFFLPASILFCMGVLFMGIGLNFMERKASI